MDSSQNERYSSDLTPFDAANFLKSEFDGDDPSWAIAATDPRATGHPDFTPKSSAPSPDHVDLSSDLFVPAAPQSVRELGLPQTQIESLILKYLLNSGNASGREISEQVGLPFILMERLLQALKMDQLVGIRSSAPVGDYVYELSPAGVDRARRYAEQCTYFGSAPVPLESYAASVNLQSVQNQSIKIGQVREAYKDMVISDEMLTRLGESMNLGRGVFLYGAPGNGKSSMAERIVRAFSEYVWIPRAISVGGQIVRLYDPIHHVAAPMPKPAVSDEIDHRWVRIHRPTITVGGELQISSFDATTHPVTGISEAPLHLKSNCGTLVIDDFGRNHFRPDELLNRMIVPLEHRSDSLQLANGRTFRVPFDCMVVFSSNLDPVTLLDESFLRRVPYRMEVHDPTNEQFHDTFAQAAKTYGMEFDPADVDYLLAEHYLKNGRPRRFCHARDLLQFMRNSCEFQGRPFRVTREAIDTAVHSYLAFLGMDHQTQTQQPQDSKAGSSRT